MDGRYVIFETNADNIFPGDANGHDTDILLVDRLTGEKSLVSLASDGVQANDSSTYSSIAPDGKSIVFMSNANNLIPDDLNDAKDIYLHDLEIGETRLISYNADGEQGNYHSEYPAVNEDGSFVAFLSEAGSLVPGDANSSADVFVHSWGSLDTAIYLPIISTIR